VTLQLLALSGGHISDDVWRGLKEGFFMFYETFWALILGFSFSGAVQAFVSRQSMQRRLGDHGPAAVARASLYGTVSSSCSYAASAMAKSLFSKGADFVASMVFMVASTNLVIELGIVLVVLIGWQFMAAEFVGGAIMIALIAVLGGVVFRGRSLADARRRVEAAALPDEVLPVGGDSPSSPRIATLAGWSDAASFSMADLQMLRREMLIGYGVAGFLAALVPAHLWNDVFVHGHGFATIVENALVAPAIALVSCVCSIGNVPLAAALWSGGISFGGVVSFIFADLIALPILLVYRRLYGTRTALRILGLFWLVMSLAGLVTEGLFDAAGLVPVTHSISIPTSHLSWNSTTFLNLAFLVILVVFYVLSRNRERLGGGEKYAIDPVCGMQVEIALAPAKCQDHGAEVYFCSEHCRDRFVADPARYAGHAAEGRYEAYNAEASVALSLASRRGGPVAAGESRSSESRSSSPAPDELPPTEQ
jgi:uncharacterized membrane protein YraQ (UPF0718 family)/YHS domain-containing protein